MKPLCSLLILALLAAGSPVCAENALGRVRTIYFEAARHVLVDPRMQRAPATAVFWADVEVAAADTPEKRRVLVQLPSELRPVPGDVVAMQLEENLSRIAANQVPMLRLSRVTEIRSRALAGLGIAE